MEENFITVKIDGKDMRLFNSLELYQVEDETREEFVMRRKLVNKYFKDLKKGKTIHVSSVLIPKMGINSEGKDFVITNLDGNPMFIGKTKGTTYVKQQDPAKEEEHMNLVEHLNKIKNEQ